MSDVAKLREMDVQALENKLTSTREELFQLRVQHASGQLEKTHRLPDTKKEISRILTVLKQKKLEDGSGRV